MADVSRLLPLTYAVLHVHDAARHVGDLPRHRRPHRLTARPVEIGESSFPRRVTRQVMVGDVPVGGGAPITVQSMTITKTADVEGTLQQIYALAGAGADIVRCTCNEIEAAEGLAQIVPRSPVPIVADIHHQYRMALAALDAGVHCLRLNPGQHPQARAHQARGAGVQGPRHPDPHRRERRQPRPGALREARRQGHPRGHGRVGPAGARLLRGGRLRRREDLREGVVGAR